MVAVIKSPCSHHHIAYSHCALNQWQHTSMAIYASLSLKYQVGCLGKVHRARFKWEAQPASIFSPLPRIQLMLNKVFVK